MNQNNLRQSESQQNLTKFNLKEKEKLKLKIKIWIIDLVLNDFREGKKYNPMKHSE